MSPTAPAPLTVRPASLSDLDTVAALFDDYRQFYEQAPARQQARDFIEARMRQGESEILLAHEASGQAVGFCQLYASFCSVLAQPIYVLYDLYVQPAARRSGAGAALLRAAHQLAQAHGKARMDLTTARSNRPAQALYASLGWVRDDVFLAYSLAVAKPAA